MDDREEITKRLLKIFFPFIGVLLLLYALAVYIESRDFEQARLNVQKAKAEALTSVPGKTATTDPAMGKVLHLPTKSHTNTTVQLREGGEKLLDQLDDETLTLLDDVSDDLEGDALQRMQAGLKLITQLNDHSVKAIDTDLLMTVLPDHMPGWTAGKITARATSLLGIHTSMARRSYTDTKGRKIFIKLMDTASMKRISALGAMTTGAADIVTETDEYIEKTIRIGSISAFAKYAKKTKSANIHAFTLERFIIEARGSDLSIEELAERVAALHLHLLPRLIETEANNDE
jgi:hypothetical protein